VYITRVVWYKLQTYQSLKVNRVVMIRFDSLMV
jgi:hypothetical protein